MKFLTYKSGETTFSFTSRKGWKGIVNGSIEAYTAWFDNICKGQIEVWVPANAEAPVGDITVAILTAKNPSAEVREFKEFLSAFHARVLGPAQVTSNGSKFVLCELISRVH